MADDVPPPPPTPPWRKIASKAVGNDESTETEPPPSPPSPQPKPTSSGIFDALLPPDALEKLVRREMDPSAMATERKEPPLLKAAITWGKLGPMKRDSNGTLANAPEYFKRRKTLNFSGNHATFVKNLYEWMEARWAWLEKDTLWKTTMQMQTERHIKELEKELPGSKGFKACWRRMMKCGQWRKVVEDYEMEGLELDLIAAWLFASSFSFTGHVFNTKHDGGNVTKRGADTSTSASGPSSAANGTPDAPPTGNVETSGSKKKKNKKKKKKKTATSTGDITASVASLSLAEDGAPGTSSDKPSTIDITAPNDEPSTAMIDTAVTNAEPSLEASASPGAPFGEASASSDTTTLGNGEGSSVPSASDSKSDTAFILVELFLSHAVRLVKDDVQLPSTLAEAIHFKLFPEMVVINTLLVVLDWKVEDIEPALWDTMKKITGITADFRVAQRDFEDRLNRRFQAICKKAKRAAKKKRKKQRKADEKIKEAEYARKLEVFYAEIGEMEAAEKAAESSKAKVPEEGAGA